jgi:glyoxylase-like metal-dependent hydrolase (beta-lactamase superfamily II)
LLAGAPPLGAQQAEDVMVMRAEQVRPRVHVVSGFTNGNILVVDTDEGVVLVDAQSEKRAGLADSVIRSLTPRPVRAVIVTHYHDDHVGGNSIWRERGAAVIAHRNVAAQAAKDTTIDEWRVMHRTPAPPGDMPTVLFTDSLLLRLGGEEVRVIHVPTAHTDGDAMVWLERANVVHTGDVLEVGAPPFIDWWAGGTLEGMLAAADSVLAHVDGDTRIVPGHGAVVDRDALRAYRGALATLGNRVRDALRAGKTLDALVASNPLAGIEAPLGSPSARRSRDFIALMYVGLRRTMAADATAARRP